jgi:hypothetical protein
MTSVYCGHHAARSSSSGSGRSSDRGSVQNCYNIGHSHGSAPIDIHGGPDIKGEAADITIGRSAS